jgi:hypothetical protein
MPLHPNSVFIYVVNKNTQIKIQNTGSITTITGVQIDYSIIDSGGNKIATDTQMH